MILQQTFYGENKDHVAFSNTHKKKDILGCNQ